MSPEEINRMQDFDAVLKAAGNPAGKGRNGTWQNGLYIAGTAVILSVASAVWYFTDQNKEQANTRQVEQKYPETMPRTQEGLEDPVGAPLVKPPVSQWDKTYTHFTLNAGLGGEIVTDNGSRIHLPANSLIDAQGNTIAGNVEIRTREFHDPYSIALSGIPMHRDSSGHYYYFESAGMIELRAFQDGKELSLKNGYNLNVQMRSGQEGDFNLYHLSETEGNWEYRGQVRETSVRQPATDAGNPTGTQEERNHDNIQETVVPTPRMQALQKEIRRIEADKPREPRKANPYRPRFDLKVDLKEFPELAGFENMQFEVAPEDKSFSPEHYKIEWNDIRLKRYNHDRYLMVLTRLLGEEKEQVVELIVIPVFPEGGFPQAQEKYEELLKDYEKRLQAKKAEEKRLREAEEARLRKETEEARRMQEEQRALETRNAAVNTREMIRVFSISGFGIWNCDNPKLAKATHEKVRFTDKLGKELPIVSAHCLFIRNNGVCPLYPSQDGSFTLPLKPNAGEIILLVLDGQRIAFKKADDAKVENGFLIMEPVSGSFGSAEEVKAFIEKQLN